ncbi:Cardiolipin synthase (CMP-forming), mitochondrial [Galdieria sulphuraria]|nr:Cardiolipin synthase (CMP-forming), mitochondrial [Galdieria sulphuraria]
MESSLQLLAARFRYSLNVYYYLSGFERNLLIVGLNKLLPTGVVFEWHIRETLEKQVSDWNIANCITGTRIASIPVIASLIYCQQYEAASMGLAAAGVTDWLDGFLARKYRLSTVLGSYLDPLADKLLINALVFTLSANQLIPFTLALLIFGRDGCLIFGSAYKRWETMKQLGNHSLSDFFHVSRIEPLKIQPLVISKWNTAAQFVLIGYSLFHGMHPDMAYDHIYVAVIALTTLTTIGSGLAYVYQVFWNKKGNVFQRVAMMRQMNRPKYL